MPTEGVEQSTIVITGMHRSGTSLTAALCQNAGVDVGKRLMVPHESNPKGFYENLDFVDFHRKVLQSQGMNDAGYTLQEKVDVEEHYREEAKKIIAENSHSQLWGWKDPRTTLFLDFWLDLLPNAFFLLIYRSPWEVVDSLYRRGTDRLILNHPDLAVKVWSNYNQKILEFSDKFPEICHLTSIYQITENTEFFIDTVNKKFNINLTVPSLEIYDLSLLHKKIANVSGATLVNHYFPEAIEIYRELEIKANRIDKTGSESWGKEINSSLSRVHAFRNWLAVRNLEKENKRVRPQLKQTQTQLEQTLAELEQVKSERQQTQAQLKQTLVPLEQAKSKRQQTQTQLEQTLAKLEQVKSERQQTQAQLEQTLVPLEQAKSKRQQTQTQLEQTLAKLEQAKSKHQQTQTQLEQASAQIILIQKEYFQSLERLNNLIEQFDCLVTSMLESNRWKFGNLLYLTYRKILLKPLDISPQEHQHRLLNKFQKFNRNLKKVPSSSQQYQRVEYLINLIQQFDSLVTSMLESNRWKFGNLLYLTYRKISLKPLDPSPQEHQHRLLNKFQECNRNISASNSDSEKHHSVEILISVIKQYDCLITSMINSNRWKLGHLLYTLYSKALRKPLDSPPQEHQKRLFNDFQTWNLNIRNGHKSYKQHQTQSLTQKINQNSINKTIDAKQNVQSTLLLKSSLNDDFSKCEVEKTISIIILNLNGAEHLNKLLNSFLIHNNYKNFEFIIVDHNSQDSSLKIIDSYQDKLPIKIIPYKENYSYSYSNNRAAEISNAEYLIFLNNDIILKDNILAKIVNYLQDDSVGVVGAKLLYPKDDLKFPDGIQHSGIKFFEDIKHGFYRPYNLGIKSGNFDASDLVQVVPAVTGALMACRRQEFLEIGGFCEDYFYGYEDVDLCLTYLNKLNKLSISNNKVFAVHDESSTQKLDPSTKVKERRLNNQAVISKRYGYAINKAWWQDLIFGHHFWADRPLVIAFAVTEVGEQAKAGDYFTALELGSTCASQFGWKIEFLARDQDWYDLSHVDILVIMVDAYDLSKIHNSKPGLIKIAWLRNWFERWSVRDCFEDYDIYLCSSDKATKYIKEKSSKVAHTFMIATNESRFKTGKVVDKFVADYCFTGSFWNTNRDIVNILEPQKIEYQFALYGYGWNKNEKLCSYWRGFIPYAKIPDIYSSSKIVIDDANHVTKPWGSVNSRVFDALASGALVITNGVEGAKEVFDGLLPSYKTQEELHSLINFYLSNNNERLSITNQLREKVLDNHTYSHRAVQLQSILADFCQNKFRIAIKVPVPKIEEVHEWGDYHLALALKRAFKKHGHSVRIDILPDWDTKLGFADDVVLVLRGLSEYTPKPNHINLMWNISHPDKVSNEEYERYDHIFVASHQYADILSKKITTPVSTLLQCTDPSIFYPETNDNTPQEEVLFVGNSRKQFRTIIKDALDADLQVSVYGTHWKNFIPSTFYKGNHIENRQLHYYYSKCNILLNDHWSSMKENGFISNRIFDAAACGCFIISDDVVGAADIFGDTLVTYKNANELKKLVEYFLEHEQERNLISNKLKEIVLSGHTFDNRVLSILKLLDDINIQELKLDKKNILKVNTKLVSL